jgi:hypothetical protein
MNEDIKCNLISANGEIVRNSYGDFFKKGMIVGDSTCQEIAVIVDFIPNRENNEIIVHTTKGLVHLDLINKVLIN